MGNQQDIRMGLVIAGGRSSRFGREKAVALLDGRSLLERACERLAKDCQAVAVSAAHGGEAAAEAARLGHPALEDPFGAPAGPLAGVLAGLIWARERGAGLLITRPCDTPFLPEDLALRLAAAAGAESCAAARTPGGVQSLCAAWRVDLIGPLSAALGDGAHPAVHRFLEDRGCRFVDYADESGFLNLNTPQDLAEAERRVSSA